MTTFVDLDVRPILRTGGEPFEKIMAAVAALEPGQGLRLFATFKPTPLLHVLGSKGFTHTAKELDDGEWEIVFSPSEIAEAMGVRPGPPAADTSEWPAAIRHLDNRDLDPPEPMVRILATIETMAAGEVLSALLCREPAFLLPELAKRGHDWRGGLESDGRTYRILVRIGVAGGPTA